MGERPGESRGARVKDRRKQQLLSRSTRGQECKRAGTSEEQIKERVGKEEKFHNWPQGHRGSEGVRARKRSGSICDVIG